MYFFISTKPVLIISFARFEIYIFATTLENLDRETIQTPDLILTFQTTKGEAKDHVHQLHQPILRGRRRQGDRLPSTIHEEVHKNHPLFTTRLQQLRRTN